MRNFKCLSITAILVSIGFAAVLPARAVDTLSFSVPGGVFPTAHDTYGIFYRPSDTLSNCLECQALNAKWSCHRVRDLSIAFRMVSSFRIHAVRAPFFAFPAAQRR